MIKTVTYTKGITYNAGNYQSIKIDYSASYNVQDGEDEYTGLNKIQRFVHRNLVIDLKSLGARTDVITGFGLDPDLESYIEPSEAVG